MQFFKTFIRAIPGYNTGELGYVETKRLNPISFRKTYKGFGNAELLVLERKDGGEIDPFENTEMIRDIAIVDNRDGQASDVFSENIGRVLWRGEAVSITTDRFDNETNELGKILCEEYGNSLAKLPISYNVLTPDFNPFYDGTQFGNYDNNSFRNFNYAKRIGAGAKWKIPSTGDSFVEVEFDDPVLDTYCWNRYKIIKKLGESEVGPVEFPWGDEEITDEIKSQNPWFFSYDIDEFSNYENRSIINALSDMLPEPFDWKFDYNNTENNNKLVIINKSTVDLPNLTVAAPIQNITIPANDTEVLNFNVRAQEIYDRVIVRGQPILWCGTLALWGEAYNDAPLIPDWTLDEENQWVEGKSELDGSEFKNEVIANVIRNTLDNVYQKFKWRNGTPQIGQRAGNYGSDDDTNFGDNRDYGFFFGDFLGIDLDENGDQAKLIDPQFDLTINNAPNKMAESWEDFLPFAKFSDDQDDIDTLQYNVERDVYASPFVISPHVILETDQDDDTESGTLYYSDRSQPFGVASSIQVGFHQDGIWLRRNYPQTDLSYLEELFRFDIDGIDRMPDQETDVNIEDLTNLPSNPLTNTDPALQGWSNWRKFLITVAGRSNQRLEAYRFRRNADGTIPETRNERVKIIEVPCEMWLIHPNTVRNLSVKPDERLNDDPFGRINSNQTGETWRDNMGNGIRRFYARQGKNQNRFNNEPGIYTARDDRQLLLNYLDVYSNLLLQPRGQMFLSLAIDTSYPIIEDIGSVIGTARDRNTTYQVNSSVASVEWMVEADKPRVNITTSVPNEPVITNTLNEAEISRGIRPDIKTNVKAPSLKIVGNRLL